MDASVHSPPLARSQGLLCREVPDGLMVYDQDRNEAHSLNQTAALVWRRCDGKTGVAEMATLLQELNLPAEEAVVWLALDRLEKAHLLQERLIRSGEAAGVSRRAVIRKLGLAGGLVALLPLVDSLTAPPAYAQASGGTSGSCTAPCQACGPTSNPNSKVCCYANPNTQSGPLVCNPSIPGSANCNGTCPAL